MKLKHKYLLYYLISIFLFICLISLFNGSSRRTKIYKEKYQNIFFVPKSDGRAVIDCITVCFLDIRYFIWNSQLKNEEDVNASTHINEIVRIIEWQIRDHWDFQNRNIFVTILKNIALNTHIFLIYMLVSLIILNKKLNKENIIIKREIDRIYTEKEKRIDKYYVIDYFNETYIKGRKNIISDNIQEYNLKYIENKYKKEYYIYIHLEDILTINNNRIINIHYTETEKYKIVIIDNDKIIQDVKKNEYLDIKVVCNNITITEDSVVNIEFNVLELINNYHENKAPHDNRI